MPYLWVKEIKTTNCVECANALLGEGWKLLEVYINQNAVFVLARGYEEVEAVFEAMSERKSPSKSSSSGNGATAEGLPKTQ